MEAQGNVLPDAPRPHTRLTPLDPAVALSRAYSGNLPFLRRLSEAFLFLLSKC